MNSVISFPDRGKWGDSKWRGNCSGHVIRNLVEHFRPKTFVDICEGSGTSGDVCREMGVKYLGLDLHKGQDFTKDPVLSACVAAFGGPAEMSFSHFPYAAMIDYGQVGKFSDPSLVSRDTSRCSTIDEFLEKSQFALLNQREGTRQGGVYATLIGDMRKAGVFRSFQADFLSMMPRDENVAVVIKMQHNCRSNGTSYAGNTIFIDHEYLLVWKKSEQTLYQVSFGKARETSRQTDITWRNLLRAILMEKGGKATLPEIYSEIQRQAGDKICGKQFWMEKVRQVLQRHFEPVRRGEWGVPQAA